jgi:hypothetical protein
MDFTHMVRLPNHCYDILLDDVWFNWAQYGNIGLREWPCEAS